MIVIGESPLIRNGRCVPRFYVYMDNEFDDSKLYEEFYSTAQLSEYLGRPWNPDWQCKRIKNKEGQDVVVRDKTRPSHPRVL